METPKHKPHVNIGKIKCDGRGGFLGQLPKDYPSEREMLQNTLQHTTQLKAEKEELLEALEKCNKFLYYFKQQSLDDAYELKSETNSLIQKMKQ